MKSPKGMDLWKKLPRENNPLVRLSIRDLAQAAKMDFYALEMRPRCPIYLCKACGGLMFGGIDWAQRVHVCGITRIAKIDLKIERKMRCPKCDTIMVRDHDLRRPS